MATIKQRDIFKKQSSRGRPDRERVLKQRAAYQWRDARRIYLACSFDRWRKLRSRLQLKDSSLAWHLMEAHDKGCNNCSAQAMGEIERELHLSASSKEPSMFKHAVVAVMRRMCQKYLDFQDNIILDALVCVEIDKKTIEQFNIKEVVKKCVTPETTVFATSELIPETEEVKIIQPLNKMARTDICSTSNVVEESDCVGKNIQEQSESVQMVSSPQFYKPSAQKCTSGEKANNPFVISEDQLKSSQGQDKTSHSVCGGSQLLQCSEECNVSLPSRQPTVSTTGLSNLKEVTQNYSEVDSYTNKHPSVSFCASTSSAVSSNSSHVPSSKSWFTHVHDSQMCEPHEKVVVSPDGTTRIVHNGSASENVIRIDLSKHPIETLEKRSHCQQSLDQHCQDNRQEIESGGLDKDMVKCKKTNLHVAESSVSCTASSPMIDNLSNAASANTFPLAGLFSPNTLLANFPHDFACSSSFSSTVGNSSVLKVLENTSQDVSQNKDVSPNDSASMEDGFEDAESNGDVPLDMSVKNEEDAENLYTCTEKSTSDDSVGTSQSSHKIVDQRSGSTFQNICQSAPAAASNNSDLDDAVATASSMQLLKHYTDRLMHHQMTSDMSSHIFGVSGYAVRRKRRFSDADEVGDGDCVRNSGGTIWPRKDMTQKEEYQHLELHPFMDFAEMLRSFPNMQQRTFYRWKRRIKDQFMFLEGQPTMTYAQFRQYFPNVKETVFEVWRSLMNGGQRFMADGSKSLLSNMGDMKIQCSSAMEKGASSKANDDCASREELFSAYYFLQQNFTVSEEHFFQVFPKVSKKTFQDWRTHILADFFKLQANPSVTYQEFQKQVSITEDTFDIWKSLLPKKHDSKRAAASATPVSASTSLSSSTPTLPPVSLLAASTKAFGASWYNSYSTLLGQLGLQFWPSLSLLSGSSLTKPQDQSSDLEMASQQVDVEDITVKQGRSGGDDTDGEDAETSGGLLDDSVVDEFVGHRSSRRLTLKPEHHYYLLNPDITYLALTSLYPGVSAQRFSRWRRKVTSALALLSREPNVTDEEFALSFPNVPSEVLALWRKRVQLGQSRVGTGNGQDLGKEDALSMSAIMAANYQQTSPAFLTNITGSPRKSSRESSLEPEIFVNENQDADQTARYSLQQESPASLRKHFKMNKEEFQFLMRYPNVDITTFSQHHPTVSVRTFYRWRGQIRKAINLLRDNPSLQLKDIKMIVPEATDEVVTIWKMHIQQEALEEKEEQPSATEKEEESGENFHQDSCPERSSPSLSTTSLSGTGSVQKPLSEKTSEQHAIGGACSSAQLHIHMNPHIEFDEFTDAYPEVSKQTFYQWKKEVETVMEYIRQHPTLKYEEVVSVVPHISRNAFNLWMHVLLGEGEDDQTSSQSQQVSSHHSHRDFASSSVSVDSGAASGRMQVTDAQARISRDTDMEQMALAYHNQLAAHKAQLAAAKEALIQQSLAQARLEKDSPATPGKQRCQSKDEMIQVMLKPSMDYNEYKTTLGGSSQRTFYRWKANIKLWREALAANPTMSYSDFTKITGEVPLHVFEAWQKWELNSANNTVGTAEYDEQTSTSGSQSQQQEDDFPVPADPGLAAAQELLQRHPEMLYEELITLKPCVTPELYRNWQKCIAMRIEYIRLIPEKTFEYFSNIFKTIKEEVFNIWKDIVLKQTTSMHNNFLYPTSADIYQSAASVEHYADPLTVPISQSLKNSSQYYQHALQYNTSSTVQGDVSSHSDHDSVADSMSLYVATNHSTTSHSPRLQSISPARSDSRGSETIRVKVESSPNTPLPSFTETVSNLSSRSAHRQSHIAHSSAHQAYGSPIVDSNCSSMSVNVKMSNSPSAVGLGQHSPAAVAAALTLSRALDKASTGLSQQSTTSYCFEKARPPEKIEPFIDTANEESKSSVGEHDCNTDVSVFSSQRQRKLQREEYIFVSQNPDIEVQEFLKQYPTVSVRSFYRWKQEILRKTKPVIRSTNGAT